VAIIIQREVPLDRMMQVEGLNGFAFMSENGGHEFHITCTRGGQKETLTGTLTAKFLRADGQTIALALEYARITEDGIAIVKLHQDCYNVPGRFQMAVMLTVDGETTCIYACVGTVQRTDSGVIVDTGDIIPGVEQLIADIDAARRSIPADYSTLAAGVVRHDIAQSLTAAQKAQALANLGLTFVDDGDGNITIS